MGTFLIFFCHPQSTTLNVIIFGHVRVFVTVATDLQASYELNVIGSNSNNPNVNLLLISDVVMVVWT